MKGRSHFITAVLGLILLLGTEGSAFGQEDASAKATPKNPILVDEFGRLPECDFRGRLDLFLTELSQRTEHRGYIINYTGLDLLSGERQGFSRTREISNHFNFRKFDPAIVTIVDGGLRSELGTEMWILPPGVEAPRPSRTVSEPRLPKKQSYLFDRGNIYLGELDEEFLLPSVLAERKASERSSHEETQSEQTVEIEEESVEAEFDLSVEEKDAAKFGWVSEPFGRSLAKETDASGVVIFYADDREYDVAALKRFVTEGVRRIEKSEKLKRDRIKVLFGGFRESMEVEFWIVPKKAMQPVATPEARPVDIPDVADTVN